MFRFFEKMIDPYVDYEQQDAPPRGLWAFARTFTPPFHKLFAITSVFSVLVAVVEVALIYYLGRIVDLLAQTEPSR